MFLKNSIIILFVSLTAIAKELSSSRIIEVKENLLDNNNNRNLLGYRNDGLAKIDNLYLSHISWDGSMTLQPTPPLTGPEPTPLPTPAPIPQMTTANPTLGTTANPTPAPILDPTADPTPGPTVKPTSAQTADLTLAPTPAAILTPAPTATTGAPTPAPTTPVPSSMPMEQCSGGTE